MTDWWNGVAWATMRLGQWQNEGSDSVWHCSLCDTNIKSPSQTLLGLTDEDDRRSIYSHYEKHHQDIVIMGSLRMEHSDQ
jgi:hypothetical protein